MDKRWRIQPHDSGQIGLLERQAGVSPVVAQLLVSRGVTHPGQARAFLAAKLSGLRDPELLPGLAEAADRIHAAIDSVVGSLFTATTTPMGSLVPVLLFRCLKLLNADCGYHVPNRLEDGYGLHEDALRRWRNVAHRW
jgi:single-stranded-DNA-specific exonuclease